MKKALWLIVAALLGAAALLQSRRLAEVRRGGLPEAYAGYTANEPPALTFILAGLGGFRGIAAEILWFRAERLQDEGRYMELVQLSDWLTRLEPHSAETWVYNAWNLAYNVSAMMPRAEDRLRWVRNGIRLLRDDALRYNPREAKLYRELAWMFQNKVGSDLDACHLAYKRAFAEKPEPPDAEYAAKCVEKYGPLDWHLAQSHAIYWADKGLEFATGPERLQTRRVIYQSLMFMVFNGKLVSSKPDWKTAPNFALAKSAVEQMEIALAEFPSKTMRRTLSRFLAVLVQSFAQNTQLSEAEHYYEKFKTLLPKELKCPTMQELIEQDLR